MAVLWTALHQRINSDTSKWPSTYYFGILSWHSLNDKSHCTSKNKSHNSYNNNNSNSHNSVYDAVIVAVNCYCKSVTSSFSKSSTSKEQQPTYKPSQSAWASDLPKLAATVLHSPLSIYYYSAQKLILVLPSHKE